MKVNVLLIVVCLSLVYITNCQLSASSSESSNPTFSDSQTPSSSVLQALTDIPLFPSSSQSSSSSPSGSSSGSSSPSLVTLTPSVSPLQAGPIITYAIQFQPFSSDYIVDEDSLISSLRRALDYDTITASSPYAKRYDNPGETVYVGNVTSGSAFDSYVSNPVNWLGRFNNISSSNVDQRDVAVFQVYSSSSQSTSSSLTPSTTPLNFIASLLASLTASNSRSLSASISPSFSASPSPLANINVAVTFPDLITRRINETEDLEYIFAETLNITDDRILSYNPNPNSQKRDVSSQTVYVINNTPTFANFISTPELWLSRFYELAGIEPGAVSPSDIQVRQLSSASPSFSASTGQTPTASFSPSPAPVLGSCPFNYPYNSTTGICVLPGQTLYLPFTGPMASDSLPDSSQNSLTICVTVNSPDCMVNPPITGRRQNTVMNSTCAQPFSRFWTQWDACLYDYAPYTTNQTFLDERNVANTCGTNRTTTQISYLGDFLGNWSFSQQPCYNSIITAKRQAPSEQCFCVPYPDSSNFGVFGRTFFTELTLYQTDDSGVPASIRVICNDFPCYNLTNNETLIPPMDYVRYDSSNERALILGIVLGFGLPCLIYCIAAIIIAILILLLLLLLGKSTTAKTFWVPSRDDL